MYRDQRAWILYPWLQLQRVPNGQKRIGLILCWEIKILVAVRDSLMTMNWDGGTRGVASMGVRLKTCRSNKSHDGGGHWRRGEEQPEGCHWKVRGSKGSSIYGGVVCVFYNHFCSASPLYCLKFFGKVRESLLISSIVCKELGSHYPLLTPSKKQNRLK